MNTANTQNTTRLAPHEELEVREILSTEITAAKKLRSSMATVRDEELKSYMQSCLDKKMTDIQTIQTFVNDTVK